MSSRTPDPNKERNDPMVPEYWELGESVQDRILASGYESPEVEGIAVDIHDVLQAADRIREELGPKILASTPDQLDKALQELVDELNHIRWHCEAGTEFLKSAREAL